MKDSARALVRLRISGCSAARLGIFAGVGIYCLLFHRAYVSDISPLYGYMGMVYNPPPGAVRVLPWALALLPALWMPAAVRRPSHLFAWVIFVTVYLPSLFVPFYARMTSTAETTSFLLALALSFALISTCMSFPVLRLPRLAFPPSLFWPLLGVAVLLMNGYVLAVFGSHLRLVSLPDVYGQRAQAAAVAGSSLVGFATSWLAYAVNPLLLAWGLERRRPMALLIGGLGQVYLYMTGGDKIFVLCIPALVLTWLVTRSRPRRFGPILIWSAVAGLAAGSAFMLSDSAAGFFARVLLVRTLSLPGLLSAQYLAFFSSHPHTLLSHVRGVSSVLRYPYDTTVSSVIGQYFAGDQGPNANAHFWVADGVAGFGVAGIFLVTPVVMAVLWLLDSAPLARNRQVAILMCVAHAAHLANASVFTSFFGGGILLTAALLYFLPTTPGSISSTGSTQSPAGRC